MKIYDDCIKDIDRALDLGYPKNQQLYSLHLRKAKCLKFLGKDYADCLDDAMQVCNFLNNNHFKLYLINIRQLLTITSKLMLKN